MAASKPKRRPKLRWWQVPCRAVVLVVLSAVAAYATLPWWLPAGWLSRRIAADLARQTGAAVRIDGMSLSWFDGVELRGLRLAEAGGAPGEPLLTVRAARTELAPVAFLLHRRVGWLELIEPVLRVRLDANGGTNLGPLMRMEPEVAIERVNVHRGRATIQLPRGPHRLALKVPSFQFDAGRVREVTMSAALEQDPNAGEAPVSLSPGAGADPTAAASASLTFSNVDLSQLPLAAVFGLPLKRLSGRCDGAVDLEAGRDGVIEGFHLNVVVRKLDVQPAGSVRLPVIEEAHLRLLAAYDQIARALEVRSASVRLPGVDLQGRGKLFAEAFGGYWEAVEEVELTGQVHPARLAALLTGRDVLPGETAVTGPVGVALRAERKGTKLHLHASADASAAEVRRHKAVLKPADRPCRMGLAGDLDHRTSRFSVAESWLELAGNRFTGNGALLSLRRFSRRLADRGRRPVGEVLLAELGRLDWHGLWEIHDLDALADVAAAAGQADAVRQVRLDGTLTGRWFIHHGATTRVHASLRAAGGTRLAVPGWFVKPQDAPLSLDLDADVDANEPMLKNIAVGLAVGAGHFSVERANLRWAEPPPGGQPGAGEGIELTGKAIVEKLQDLLACIPRAAELRDKFGGDLSGRFDVRAGSGLRRARLSADLRDARLSLAPWLIKPAGRDAQFHVDFRADPAGPKDRQALLAALWASDAADVTLNCSFPKLRPGEAALAALTAPTEAEMDWIVEAVVKDARRLAASSPILAERLAGTNLSGQLKLIARGALRPGTLDADAFCDATDLQLDRPNPIGRTKAAGTKLSLRVDGRVTRRKQDGRIAVQVRNGELSLGASRLALAGRAAWGGAGPAPGGKFPLVPALRSFDVDANALVAAEPVLLSFVPEMAAAVRRHGLAGQVAFRATARCDGNAVDLRSRVDAGRLALARLVLEAPGEGAGRLGPFVKPAGLPAEAEVAFTAPADLSAVRVTNLSARVGDVRVLASGSAGLERGRDGLPAGLGKVDVHLAASTPRAERLVELLPSLRPYRPSGGIFIEAELPEAHRGAASHATVRLDDLRCTLGGRELALDGELAMEQLARPRRLVLDWPEGLDDRRWQALVADALPRVGRLRTDGMEFRTGRSHGWLLADLSSLPGRPRGTFHVLADRLDLQELTQSASRAGGAGATTRPSYKLTDVEVHAVRRRARRAAALLRKHLIGAKVSGRASVRHLHAYDVSVDCPYDVRRLELTVSADDGRVKVAFAGGLNGGVLREEHTTDLAAASPTVASDSVMAGVLAEANIQPQFAKFFPGNTVRGTLTRREKTTASLSEAIAAAMDPRCPVRRSGWGKTVAEDGVTQGRAAPKFVAQIFPGLNLASYEYRKMTAFAEISPDGTTKNDMVFRGKAYDLYMEGTTDAEDVGRYEIGLILLGTPQSAEWNHTYRQGRIPLLNFKARIEGGKMHDEEVSYLWPNETLFVIFLKNNIFYRIWLAAGQNRER